MKKCLIIDDVEVSRFSGRLFLEELGFEVIEAQDANTALGALSENPDVILLDWHLKKESGIELLENLREKNNNTPVIMFSGVEEQGAENEARSHGANGYIQKPTTKEKLEKALRNIGIL